MACPEPKVPQAIASNMRAQNSGIIALLNSRAAEITVSEERSRMASQERSSLKVSFVQILLQNLVRVVVFLLTAAAAGKFFFS